MKPLYASGVFVLAVLLLAACGNKSGQHQAPAPPVTDTLQSARAIDELTGLIAKKPGDPGLHYRRGLLYLGQNAFELAYTDLAQAIRLDSTRPEYYLSLADVFFATNKSFEAKKALEKCLEADPGNEDAHSKLAEIYFLVRKYQEAMNHTRSLLDKDPADARALFMQGMIFKESGDTAGAINSFQRALESDERLYNAYMQLGVLYTARENPVCLEYFDGALRVNASSQEALYGKALWHQEHGNLDQALQDYTSIVQLNPNHKHAHFNMGYLHYTYLKVYDQAIRHYNDAIAADGNYAEAFFNRGLCYEALGNISAAASDYNKALSLRPGYALALEGLKRVQ